ncbi:hypothetical protein CVO77_09130 [Sphingopyxis lindanitolerans]|uniref:Pili assembly chaperone N-terminal domain-containing protein n=1 Tax=Sphingopyxis lindanitolerans TaxID=2054227 RepID=A0A2S8B862_9SPHN|nr:fimbria/pilus periplasmic chaperone [Sphingopyxis lindanitolerans]PQM28595.1 hypothetical protein CVO77_09130 [Sphingopyxis lindanitolerans]
MFRKALTAAVAILYATTAQAQATGNLSIDKLWVEFSGEGTNRGDVLIRNDSKDRYYVTITTSEILNPGSAEETRVARADPEAAGLLVTPNRLILDPGVMRAIRIVSLNEAPQQDRIYRVLVSPEVASEAAAAPADKTSTLQIRLMAAYDILVVVRPKGAKPDLHADRSADKIILSNQGGTNILLSEMSACPAQLTEADATKCRHLDSVRLYAGQATTVGLQAPDEKIFLKTRTGPSDDLIQRSF